MGLEYPPAIETFTVPLMKGLNVLQGLSLSTAVARLFSLVRFHLAIISAMEYSEAGVSSPVHLQWFPGWKLEIAVVIISLGILIR